jgi:hypothetical protein
MPDNSRSKDDVDLMALATVLLRGWKIILACLCVTVGLALLWFHYTPKAYAVRMIVVPVQTIGEKPESGAPGANTSFNLYIQSLHARGLAEKLAANSDAMDALDTSAGGQGRDLSGSRIQRILALNLTVDRDAKASPAATIVLTTANPYAGAKFLALLHRAANDYAKSMVVPPVAIDNHQAVPVGDASPSRDAARLFDGPYASDMPISPRLGTALRDAIVLGLLLGGVLVWLMRGRAASLWRFRREAVN